MKHWKALIWVVAGLSVVLICSEMGVFWDNVLFVSRMGMPLFTNGVFSWSSIPLNSDPGHPPFIASIMALNWQLFGKSLAVSHWVMLPFIVGFFWQLDLFVNNFVEETKYRFFAYILVLADPTILSQIILIGPEIIQLFFFLFAINGAISKNNIAKAAGLALLSIVSFRGMMMCAGVFLFEVVAALTISRNSIKKVFNPAFVLSYFLASVPSLGYLLWRLHVHGWIISNPMAPWGNAWHFESVTDFFSNLTWNFLVFNHHILDFGRVVIFILIFTLGIKYKTFKDPKAQLLMIFSTTTIFVIVLISLLIKNPMGHRYFLPLYIGMGILVYLVLMKSAYKKFFYITAFATLISGNLFVYPDTIAQGWDSSLAHIPYWKLRKEAIVFMDKNHIEIEATASFFPNQTSIDNVDLNGDQRSFKPFTGSEKFVFFSNVYNLSDSDFKLLHSNYLKLKNLEYNRVRVEIWEHK